MSEFKEQNRRKELERTSAKDEASDENKILLSKQSEEKRPHIWMEEQQKPRTRQHNPTGNEPQNSAAGPECERNFKALKKQSRQTLKDWESLNRRSTSAKSKYKKHKPLKKCPFCAELIKVEAIKCRFCGEIVDITRRGSMQAPHAPIAVNQSASGAQGTWNPGVAAVLSLIIPGAGQIYKGQIVTGILFLIFVLIRLYVMFFSRSYSSHRLHCGGILRKARLSCFRGIYKSKFHEQRVRVPI